MKKILLSILALGGLLFASSCQMQEPDSGTITGEVDFSITAGIPSVITTYADPIPAFSHLGGASNLSKNYYILRYTLQVFDNDGKLAYEGVQYAEDFGGVTFEARLLAKEYDFVFWADFVSKNNKESDLYYNTEDLREISYTSYVTADILPSDALDAYYKKEVVNLTQAGQHISDVVLKRPFGKIRFVAIDDLSELQKDEMNGVTVTVKYQDGTVLPNVFNAQTGKSSASDKAPQRVSDYTTSPIAETASVSGTPYEDAYLLGFDYVFCNDEIPSYTMDVKVSGMTGVADVIRSLSSIPVQENKLTTVVGNFYTNEGKIDVIIDDNFDGEGVENVPETINVTTSAGIQDAIDAAQDGDIIVIGPGTYGAFDVTKSETQSFFQLPTDKSLTFRGANAGVAGTGSRNEETVITIPFTYAHSTTTTADFTFDGLKFTENGRVSVGKASTGDLTFINNIVTGITINSDPGTTFFTTPYVYDNNSYTMEDIVVENNLVDGTTLSDGTNSCGFRMWGISSATFKNNTFKNFNHSASQFDHVTGDLNFDGNTFEDCNNYKFRVQVINIEGERNYGSNVDDVTEKGFMKIEGTGTCYDTFEEVLAAANANDVIILAEGEYPLDRTITATDNQQYYLPIETAGLTIKAQGSRDKTIVYGREYTDNGAISTQNLITVMASDVTIEGITIMPKVEVNKTIEIRNTGFTLIGCRITPNTYVKENNNGKGGSVYFTYPTYNYTAGTTINGTITDNIIEKATVSFDHIYEGTIEVSGNVFDGGNIDSPMITTPIWGQVDLERLKSSKLVVNVSNNEFRNVAEYNGSNSPAVRPSYGIINLDNNTFPTDGICWAATAWDSSNEYGNYCNFGSVFVDYDSVIGRKWTAAINNEDPKSFAISNDIIEMELTDDYGWRGRKAKVNMVSKSSWEMTTTLTVTKDSNVLNAIELSALDVRLSFKRDGSGNAQWQYWDASYVDEDGNEGIWKKINEEGISVEPGEHSIKVAFGDSKITCFIDGIIVYQFEYSSTAAIEVIELTSFGYRSSYKATWTYPVIKF